jgi:phage-related protein
VSTSRPPFSLISILANTQRHAIASGDPWLLLMQIVWPGNPTPGTPTQSLCFVRDCNPITFDCGDGRGPQVYQPFNFDVGETRVGSDGSVPEVTITASNVMRILQGIIEQYAGIVGADLFLYAVNTANPAGEPDLTLQFQIKQTVCNAKSVQIKCGAASPLRRLFPIYKFWPNTCIWQYKSGVGCSYTGGMPSCSKTIDGPAGCKAHFAASIPLPFGGFPGIDTVGITAAGVV